MKLSSRKVFVGKTLYDDIAKFVFSSESYYKCPVNRMICCTTWFSGDKDIPGHQGVGELCLLFFPEIREKGMHRIIKETWKAIYPSVCPCDLLGVDKTRERVKFLFLSSRIVLDPVLAEMQLRLEGTKEIRLLQRK